MPSVQMIDGVEFGDAAFSGGQAMVVSHCLEGRFECAFQECEGTLFSGDLAVGVVSCPLGFTHFPLSRYRGISIVFDMPRAAGRLGAASYAPGAAKIDLYAIKARLCGDRSCCVMRPADSTARIFTGLYNALGTARCNFIRFKVVELLLFLSGVGSEETRERRCYFYRPQVDAVNEMREYMLSHLDRHFTLKELSARFDISTASMKNCFKGVFGTTMGRYMRERRLQAAAAMLRETDAPIADISEKVGYGSHSKFSAAFKAFTGFSPSEYRKKQ